MGLLKRWDAAVALSTRNVVGRADECTLRLDDPSVSGSHATLTWKSDHWIVRDLGSRNGTFVGTTRVAPGEPKRLSMGDSVRFGLSAAWTLVAAGPPGPVASSVRGVRECAFGMLILPHDESPQLVVYGSDDGGWVCERVGGEPGETDLGSEYQIDGVSWTIHCPSTQLRDVATTVERSAQAQVETIGLTLRHSQDEEHVDVFLRMDGSEKKLRSRVHSLLLLQLARQRLEDVGAGLRESEVGWVHREDLCRQIRVTPSVLNLQMLRARQQLAVAGVEGVSGLFSRRRLSGQLRIEVADVRVERA